MLVVQYLLQLGFEVNFRDYARKTALFFAIEKRHLDVADYLIERAASMQSKEQKMRSFCDTAHVSDVCVQGFVTKLMRQGGPCGKTGPLPLRHPSNTYVSISIYIYTCV